MIFIGYDDNYQMQYDNCIKSIGEECHPTPFIDIEGSTKFTVSRFLIPEQTDYKGWHIFADSDFIFLEDINKLYELINEEYAIMVVKHAPYQVHSNKMDGKTNSYYDKKNWASLILWNSSHPKNKVLTKEFVKNTKPIDLLQFKWLDESDIGEVPAEWNVLVDHHDISNAKALHFTNGVNNEQYASYINRL